MKRCLATGVSCLMVLTACGAAPPPPAEPPPSVDLAASSPPPPAPSDQPTLSPEVAKGVSALDANDLAGAKAHFQAALQANPKDADALYFLGALSEKAGDLAAAETSYKAALHARAGFAGAEVNLSALYDDAQRWDDALAVTTPGLVEHPKDGSLHLNAAIAYGGRKDAASSVREFDSAVAISPSDPTFRLVYGHWLAAFGKKDAAVSQLQAALPFAAKNVGVVAAVGHELHVMQALPECVAAFTTAIAMKDAAELITERAACKIAQKDDAGAVADLRSATTKEPGYAPAHYYLGNELAKSGDYAGAVAEYQTFLKLEPNGALARAVTEKIKLAKQHH